MLQCASIWLKYKSNQLYWIYTVSPYRENKRWCPQSLRPISETQTWSFRSTQLDNNSSMFCRFVYIILLEISNLCKWIKCPVGVGVLRKNKITNEFEFSLWEQNQKNCLIHLLFFFQELPIFFAIFVSYHQYRIQKKAQMYFFALYM